MATNDEIALFRRMIGELTDAEPWNDLYLSQLIDSSATMTEAARTVWTNKAAMYAGLVDTTESGSSRRLSQLQEQALKMATYYGAGEGAQGNADDLTGASYTIQAVRP